MTETTATETTATETIAVPAVRIPDMEGKLAKLARKSAKLGLTPPSVKVSDPYVVVKTLDDGRKARVTYVDVTVSTEPIGVDGWDFVAAVDHMGEAGNVIRRLGRPDVDLVEFRTRPQLCEHCGTLRGRKSTFVLVNNQGETQQVGSSCLADFLGGHSASQAVAAALLVREYRVALDEFGEEGFSFGSLPDAVGISELLTLVHAVVRNEGWVSKKDADESRQATADVAMALRIDLFYGRIGQSQSRFGKEYVPTEADGVAAAEDLQWALSVEGNSEYINNLRVIAKAGYCRPKQVGLGGSIYIAHKNAVARAAEAEARTQRVQSGHVGQSRHVGQVEERRVFEGLKLLSTQEWDGRFGTTVFHKFVDDQGNVLVWKGSHRLKVGNEAVKDGAIVSIKATIKEHTDFRGTAQTVIARAVGIDAR